MKFPETNKIHKKPIPENLESNAKLLEERIKNVEWSFFGQAYIYLLGYTLLTVSSFILVIGFCKWVIKLLNLWL